MVKGGHIYSICVQQHENSSATLGDMAKKRNLLGEERKKEKKKERR